MEGDRPRYTWLIFDADGTLFDFHRGETTALQETTDRYGISYSSAPARRLLRDQRRALGAIRTRRDASSSSCGSCASNVCSAELKIDLEPEPFNNDFMETLGRQTQLLDGAEDVVRDLSSRFRLLLATNGIAVVQRARFSSSSIRRYFEDVLISDEIGVAKPQTRVHGRGFLEHGQSAEVRGPDDRRQPELGCRGRCELRDRHLLVQSEGIGPGWWTETDLHDRRFDRD